jgi:hypothetical protein
MMSPWRFCEVVNLTEKEEDEIWNFLIKVKKEGKQADEIARIILEKVKGFERNKAYLWALVTGKFFGLHGV